MESDRDEPFVLQPSTLWVPTRLGSYGPEIVDFADEIGILTDVEQRRDIDCLASYGRYGRWLCPETLIVEGRQNGKTKSVLLPIAMADFWLLATEPDRIIWTSHLMRTSRDTFERMKELIEGSPMLSARVKELIEAKSEEAIILMDGSRFEFHARSKGVGRGLSGRRIVFDETLYVTSESMGSLMPTLSSRDNPQIAYASSAAKPESDHLRALLARGRRGGDPSLICIEYKAPGGWDEPGCAVETCPHAFGTDGCALDNEDHWRVANHAIHRRRMRKEFVRAERRTLDPLEFGRERLGWGETGDAGNRPISAELWDACAEPMFDRSTAGSPVFYLDVSPGQRSASIGVAVTGKSGRPHVELAAHRAGTDWLVGRAQQLQKRFPFAVFGGSAAGGVGALIPALEAVDIKLETFTNQELGRACGHLQRLAMTGQFSHSGDPLLGLALATATKRDIGDGLWTWVRSGPIATADLSPLYAYTGALWLLEIHSDDDYDLLESVR